MEKLSVKKWLSLFMVFALLIMGALAGCSNNSQSNTESKDKDVADSSKPLEIKMVLPLFEEVPDMKNQFWTEFQKRTNTKLDIEWVPSGDFDTKFDLVLSSGALPDVIWAPDINSPNLLKAIENGAFWEAGQFLGDFSDYPNFEKYSSPNAWRFSKVNDKIYGIPRNRPSVDQGIKIRKDWLDNLGLPVPTTLEEYADALEAMVKQDPDGNGKNDTIGHVHSYGGTGIHAAIAAGFGALDPAHDDEGGMIHYNLHPGFVDTVKYFRDLYSRGILPKEFSTMSTTQTQELFESGKAASYIRNIWRAWMFQDSIKKVEPNAEVIVLDLKGPKGPAVQLEPGVYGSLMLSSKLSEEKVKRILDYFEQTNTPEFFDFIFYGQEGVHYNLDDKGNKVTTDVGKVEIGTSVQQPLPLAYTTWMKSLDKNAPKEYNDRILKETAHFEEIGKVNPFSYLKSDTWTDVWPRYQNEWQSNVVKTIVGEMSVEQFEKYIDSLKNKSEFKKAFKEFDKSYKAIWKK
jgi:putative aldouronate transport system substrate-binding protein